MKKYLIFQVQKQSTHASMLSRPIFHNTKNELYIFQKQDPQKTRFSFAWEKTQIAPNNET
jgi:hypothetical protein